VNKNLTACQVQAGSDLLASPFVVRLGIGNLGRFPCVFLIRGFETSNVYTNTLVTDCADTVALLKL